MKIFFKVSLILFCLFFPALSFGQKKFTISGYVKEANTGESVLGANVYIKENLLGTQTNQYGFFSLTVPEGKYTLVFSFIGLEEQQFEIDLHKNIQKNVNLAEKTVETKEVVISGEQQDRNVKDIQMGSDKVEIEQLKKLPAFMGEVDILKSIQLLPGVQSGGEGNTGYYVRGGSLDQNLILLDEATVYNASHLFGFFSVFNADAIQNATFTKGGMPAQY
ncbi:MAG: carboxypeptidase-like regulatory domain-containing protein, partial [Bacteroidia bacterium]